MSIPYGLGRLWNEDTRDSLYPFSAVPIPKATSASKYWWSGGWFGDQGVNPHCVAFSLAHWLNDGPKLTSIFKGKRHVVNTQELYCEAQKRDPWPGDCQNPPFYEGTSVRAGLKVLQEWGYVKEYRWIYNTNELTQALLVQGPVVVGTRWTHNMFYPDSNGVITPGGANAGGHAYLLNGVNTVTGMYRIKNSWSKSWGRGGHAYIKIENFAELLSQVGAEAVVPLQKSLAEILPS